MSRSFNLKQKKVIDADSAEMIGYISDMDVDIETGKIISVTVPKNGLSRWIKSERNITVPWDRVVAIGSEYILVKTEGDIK